MENKQELTHIVENEVIIRKCLTYDEEVQVPKDLYNLSQKEQQKGIKQDHRFPGGYISPLGGVFSSYGAFNDYTQ